MTIDEAIAKHRKIAETQKALYDACTLKERNKHFLREAEEHEQLANWLEELVMLRLDSCMIHMPERLHLVENGYNKALNDFAEKLNAKCDRMIKEKWNSNVAPISWAEAYADFKDDINDIAEQLKEGGEENELLYWRFTLWLYQ